MNESIHAMMERTKKRQKQTPIVRCLTDPSRRQCLETFLCTPAPCGFLGSFHPSMALGFSFWSLRRSRGGRKDSARVSLPQLARLPRIALLLLPQLLLLLLWFLLHQWSIADIAAVAARELRWSSRDISRRVRTDSIRGWNSEGWCGWDSSSSSCCWMCCLSSFPSVVVASMIP